MNSASGVATTSYAARALAWSLSICSGRRPCTSTRSNDATGASTPASTVASDEIRHERSTTGRVVGGVPAGDRENLHARMLAADSVGEDGPPRTGPMPPGEPRLFAPASPCVIPGWQVAHRRLARSTGQRARPRWHAGRGWPQQLHRPCAPPLGQGPVAKGWVGSPPPVLQLCHRGPRPRIVANDVGCHRGPRRHNQGCH